MTAKASPAPTAANAGLEGQTIEIRYRDGDVLARSVVLGVHGRGATADAAIRDMQARLSELQAFEIATGLDPHTRLSRGPTGGWFGWRRLAVPVIAGGIIAMQLGWALSLGISNGIGRAFDSRWRDGLVLSLERQVLAHAESGEAPSAEQQRRLVEAIRALKIRYGPVWGEITGSSPDGAR